MSVANRLGASRFPRERDGGGRRARTASSRRTSRRRARALSARNARRPTSRIAPSREHVIVSSGLGGVYPRGIPIGTVIAEIEDSPSVWARTYLLRPSVLPADMGTVLMPAPSAHDRECGERLADWRARPTPPPVPTAARRCATSRAPRARSATRRAATPPPPTAARHASRRTAPRFARPCVRQRDRRGSRCPARVRIPAPADHPVRPSDLLRTLIAFVDLVVLHYTLRPLLGWRASPDFLVIALLLVAVRVRPGAAALIGLCHGYRRGLADVHAFGAGALGMTRRRLHGVVAQGSILRGRVALNAFFFFLGKWVFDMCSSWSRASRGGTEIAHAAASSGRPCRRP